MKAAIPGPSAPPGTIRPGISDTYLAAAGVHHRDGANAGLYIPHHRLDESRVIDNGEVFGRTRLASSRGDQKYHQESGTTIHGYIPIGLINCRAGAELYVVEGEFKSLALMEAGFPAVGISGFFGFSLAGGEAIVPELEEAIEHLRPERVFFIGDTDTALNHDFSLAAVRFAQLLDRQILLPRLPFDGPKGCDDARQEMRERFNAWWADVVAQSIAVTPKSKPGDLACTLLEREAAAVSKARRIDRAAVDRKLVTLVADLSRDALAQVRVYEIIFGPIGFSDKAGFKKAVRQMEDAKDAVATPEAVSPRLVNPEPWPGVGSVNGAELLAEIETSLRRFLILDDHAFPIISVWLVHTYLFSEFRWTPYLYVHSPEGECGKSTLGEFIELHSSRPLNSSNSTPPAMFRDIEAYKPTLILDEWDSTLPEARAAAISVLNSGAKFNGFFRRCEGDQNEVKEFQTFCPKVILGLSKAKLPPTTYSRCISIEMVKKRPGERIERFSEAKVDALAIRRKCVRWAEDNRARVVGVNVSIPDWMGPRQADIYEPLLTIAALCGKPVMNLIVESARKFCQRKPTVEDIGHELLCDVRGIFEDGPPINTIKSEDLCSRLAELTERRWATYCDGRPINPNKLSNLLRPYGICSRQTKVVGKNNNRYHLEDFQDVWERYSVIPPDPNLYPSTTPANIGECHDSTVYHEKTEVEVQKCVSSINDGPGRQVDDPTSPQGEEAAL